MSNIKIVTNAFVLVFAFCASAFSAPSVRQMNVSSSQSNSVTPVKADSAKSATKVPTSNKSRSATPMIAKTAKTNTAKIVSKPTQTVRVTTTDATRASGTPVAIGNSKLGTQTVQHASTQLMHLKQDVNALSAEVDTKTDAEYVAGAINTATQGMVTSGESFNTELATTTLYNTVNNETSGLVKKTQDLENAFDKNADGSIKTVKTNYVPENMPMDKISGLQNMAQQFDKDTSGNIKGLKETAVPETIARKDFVTGLKFKVDNADEKIKFSFDNTNWGDVADVSELGSDGADGKTPVLIVEDEKIKYYYDNDTENKHDLVELHSLKGEDAKNVHFNLNEQGILSYKHDGDAEYTELGNVKGSDGDGKTPVLVVEDEKIKYYYDDDAANKHDLVELTALKGENGDSACELAYETVAGTGTINGESREGYYLKGRCSTDEAGVYRINQFIPNGKDGSNQAACEEGQIINAKIENGKLVKSYCGGGSGEDPLPPVCPTTEEVEYNGCKRIKTTPCEGEPTYGECLNQTCQANEVVDVKVVDGKIRKTYCGGGSGDEPICPFTEEVEYNGCKRLKKTPCEGEPTYSECLYQDCQANEVIDVKVVDGKIRKTYCGGGSGDEPICPFTEEVEYNGCKRLKKTPCEGEPTYSECLYQACQANEIVDVRVVDGKIQKSYCGGGSGEDPLPSECEKTTYSYVAATQAVSDPTDYGMESGTTVYRTAGYKESVVKDTCQTPELIKQKTKTEDTCKFFKSSGANKIHICTTQPVCTDGTCEPTTYYLLVAGQCEPNQMVSVRFENDKLLTKACGQSSESETPLPYEKKANLKTFAYKEKVDLANDVTGKLAPGNTDGLQLELSASNKLNPEFVSFDSDQIGALNSGITSADKTKIDGLKALAFQAKINLNSDVTGTLAPGNVDLSDYQEKLTASNKLSADYVSGLATVATTGSYANLTNKPTLSAVATSGSYSDLSGKPTLSAVATSGNYTDLSNTPTIPTSVSQLRNDSGFITSSALERLTEAVDALVDGGVLFEVTCSGGKKTLSTSPTCPSSHQ